MTFQSFHRRPQSRWRALGLCAVLSLLAVTSWPRQGQATIVERIVAVVGERAILMSDLRDRATPLLLRINQELPAGSQRSAAISQLYKSVIERLVDEELIARAARKSKIVISDKDVDQALATLAKQNSISVERLMQEARAQGQSEAKYRDEIRRQLLEYRVLNLRLQGRIQVRDEDLRRAYREIVLQERRKQEFTAAWILVHPQTGSAQEQANRVIRELHQGRDFGDLARQYSADHRTAQKGGLLGKLAPGKLPTAIDRAVLSLEPGETTIPIHIGDTYVIVRLVSRDPSDLPTLEEARNELTERVYSDKMSQARRRWLDGLRKQMHVEIRL